MKHVIGKQVIQLQVGTDQDAFLLQNQFSKMYWEDLVPAMEKLFDELTDGDEYIAIDKLEIDLGVLTTMELRKEIILPILRQEMKKWFQRNKTQTTNIERTSIQQSVFEKWIFFLTKGYLPWSISHFPENWTTSVLDNLASNVHAINRLQKELSHSIFARKRLVQQHDAEFLQHVIEAFTAKNQAELIPFLETLASEETKESFWDFAIEKTIVKQNKIEDLKLLQAYKDIVKIDSKKEKSLAKIDILQEEETTISKEGIFIQNAGIVLLHPFLTRFFKRCDLLVGNEFKDHEAVSKAIHLLHYMATDTEEPNEHDLSLLKFLCGIPFNIPIKKYLQLSAEEKEEADALLQVVIEHWGALGAVSNASLQETFLQRDGKLYQTQNGWRLQIEKKTLDILLNQLPWNISIVKLQWMKEFVTIDWI